MAKKSSSSGNNGKKKGAWTEDEDNKLRNYVQRYGHWNWRLLPKFAGLERCGKSCRLRWMNYLKPGLKKGKFSKQEKDLIVKLHKELGNKWSAIAAKFPGRTDNDIKNFWHAHIQKPSRRISNKSSKISTQEHADHQFSKDVVNEVLSAENPENQLLSTYENGTSTYDNDHTNNNYSSDSLIMSEQQISFWTEPFLVDTPCSEDYYCLSPLPEISDIFQPQQLHYSELSSFGSMYCPTALDWDTDDHHHSLLISSNLPVESLMQDDFWNEPFTTDAFQDEYI